MECSYGTHGRLESSLAFPADHRTSRSINKHILHWNHPTNNGPTNPKRQLQVLATPDLHAVVKCTDFIEKLAINCEKPTSHSWLINWFCLSGSNASPFTIWNGLPLKDNFLRTTTIHIERHRGIFKSVLINYVDSGTWNGISVFGDPLQKWFEPSFGAFTVSVQERNGLTLNINQTCKKLRFKLKWKLTVACSAPIILAWIRPALGRCRKT